MLCFFVKTGAWHTRTSSETWDTCHLHGTHARGKEHLQNNMALMSGVAILPVAKGSSSSSSTIFLAFQDLHGCGLARRVCVVDV